MKKIIFGISLFIVASSVRADVVKDAEELLSVWCDGMIAHQLDWPKDKALDGGMICPACGFLHGRICDAVLGLVTEWRITGDAKYLKAAEKAVDWTEANMLRPGGYYMNDEQTPWLYTTVFSNIAFYKTLSRFGEYLPKELKAKWEAIYRRQVEWMLVYFLRPEANPVVNYWGNFAEAMAEAGIYLKDEKYTTAAKNMIAELDKKAFTPEGLLRGEAHPLYEGSPARNNFAVDFGYNLEETIPALLHAAELLEDKEFEAKVVKSALLQLETLLPDGAIDNSMGSRSSKWTYTGSRTSDGVLPLLAMLEQRGEKWAHRAAEKVIALHKKLTSTNGLLYGGIHYADADEPPCIHHTFTHVKSIAEYVLLYKELKLTAPAVSEKMPRERTPRLIEMPSISTYLVGLGPWRATFSANDAYVIMSDRRYSVGGGSPTLLWHEQIGPVLAATQYNFFYTEPMNQQDQRHDSKVLTTNSRLVTPDEKFTNVYDYKAMTVGELKKDVYEYRVSGKLTDKNGKAGAPFEFKYRLSEAGYEVAAKSAAPGRYYFPVIAGGEVKVEIDGNTALVKYPAKTLKVTATKPIKLERTERGDRAFTIIGGFMSAQLYVEREAGEEVKVTIE